MAIVVASVGDGLMVGKTGRVHGFEQMFSM